jgi:hypothetical protein
VDRGHRWTPIHIVRSELSHEGHEIALFLLVEVDARHEIEELDGVLQRQQSPVVQVRRRVLDAAEREGLDLPDGTC